MTQRTKKTIKEPVRIREKTLSDGTISLYLDVYVNGNRTYEFLKLYLIPEKTKADKAKNAETMRLAEAIKSLRIVDIQNGRFGFKSQFKLDTRFFDYYDKCIAERERDDSKGNTGNWLSARKHLSLFWRPNITLGEISDIECEKFKVYLERKAKTPAGEGLSKNSQHSYFCKLKACLKQAVIDGLIPSDPSANVFPTKEVVTERCYLTQDEVKVLAKAECRYPVLRRAFLFSCLTGIRWSDINKMRWSEVHEFNGGTRIVFTQKKTQELEYLDITAQGASLLGERGEPSDRVFVGLKYTSYVNAELVRWAASAGISKPVTFHSARHTFAVMMIDLGTDIYTVQKLLGHKDIRTTQIYTKVLDKRKQEAVDNIPDLL